MTDTQTRTLEVDARGFALIVHQALSQPAIFASEIPALLATWTSLVDFPVDENIPVDITVQAIHDQLDDILNGEIVLILKES